MKNIIRTIVLVTMLGIVFVSCSDEGEDPAPKTNFFSVDGTEYSLSEGLTIEYGGSETSGYNFDLLVFSSGLEPDLNTETFTGEGDFIYFELWSTSTTGLVAGTYTISTENLPNTFTSNNININYVASTKTSDAEYEASAGTVTIAVDGSTYSINFDLTVTGGKTLTGNYTGTLPNA